MDAWTHGLWMKHIFTNNCLHSPYQSALMTETWAIYHISHNLYQLSIPLLRRCYCFFFSLHAFHFHLVLCSCGNGDRNWRCHECFAEPLGGRVTRWTHQFYLPDPGRLVEPFKAVGADPGQWGGACRPVGPQANHQPWSGLRNPDPLHHQSHRGK